MPIDIINCDMITLDIMVMDTGIMGIIMDMRIMDIIMDLMQETVKVDPKAGHNTVTAIIHLTVLDTTPLRIPLWTPLKDITTLRPLPQHIITLRPLPQDIIMTPPLAVSPLHRMLITDT